MKRFSKISVFLTMVLCLAYTINSRWTGSNGNAWIGTIGSDGFGYYAYLPCVFIYHKFDYDRVQKEQRRFNPGTNVPTVQYKNKAIDKYFPGVAILLAPFFLLAYLLSYLLGYTTGGYEWPFQVAVSIGALFYLALGLIFLRKLLKEFGVSEFITGLSLILVVFGTNLLNYSVMDPSMSHVYNFGLSALFLYLAKKSINDFRFKYLLWMSVTLSLMLLVRPTNLLNLAFVPFLAGSYKDTVLYIKKFFGDKKLLILPPIAFSIFSILFILRYKETGDFFVWSYPGEGFHFGEPHFADVLFSYCKGWFIYTPLMFIAVTGSLFPLFKTNRFRFFNAVLFFLLVTYVLSSWWAWWYGSSFGLRAYIDFYPAFALLLAIFLNSLTSLWLKVSVVCITFLCVFLNLFQLYQYTFQILPMSGTTKDQYWTIFLKKGPIYNCIFDYPDTTTYNFMPGYDFKNDFEHNTWGGDLNITAAYSRSGTHSAFVNEIHSYSPGLVIKDSLLPKNNPLYVFVKLWVYMPDFKNNALIVVSVENPKGEVYSWQTKNIRGYVFKKKKWTYAYALMGLPDIKKGDVLKAYVLNTEGMIYIDDMEVTFGTPK